MTTEVRSNNELAEAIKNNDLETFKKLCTTDTKNIIIVDQFHRCATNRFNVLQWACYLGNPSIEMMQYFLDEGIDVNDGKIGSALAFLCLSGTAKLDAVKFLVENGANVKKQKLEFYIDGYYAYYGIETDQATPLQLLLYRQKVKKIS